MRIRLSTRFILSISFVSTVVLLLLVTNSVRLLNNHHKTILQQYIHAETDLISTALQPGLVSGDPGLVNDALLLLKGNKDIVYIDVYNRIGKLVATIGKNQAEKNQIDFSLDQAIKDGVFDIRKKITLYNQFLGEFYIGFSVKELTEITRKTIVQNTIIALIGLFILVVLIVILTLYLTRNLTRLEKTAIALQQGKLDTRIDIDENNEVGDLSRAFNQLAQHLQESQHQVEQEQHKLEMEKELLETRVKSRTRDLEFAVKELESFSYTVSHDLRAPLRHIDGFSHAIQEEYSDKLDETGNMYLDKVRSATKRMGYLIEDLLRLARVGRHELSITTVNLSDLSRIIVNKLKQTNPDRSVQISIESDIRVNGDRQLLEIVLDNLLGNAWKYTKNNPQTVITFGEKVIKNETAYFVRDNGVGFNIKYAGKIFKPFERLHSADVFEGTGIGLATVERVVQHHRGRVWAESEEDKGTTIYFTLNVNQAEL
ncbi:MAG TPA: HAMP domain-containing protein [Gammaproteobacteria bacterium]|nr:HAMP domain-containing protein [Gammaproteobacteria bacterium]